MTASSNASGLLLALVVLLAIAVLGAHASDPDILFDFIVPKGVTLDANFFTHRELRKSLNVTAPRTGGKFVSTRATQLEFPALKGQSVSLAVLEYAPGAVNPPHTHARYADLLLVVQGWLEVGLVTSEGKLLVQTLQAGDMFVFPKGLVHYQVNRDVSYPAIAVSAFGSANAGTVWMPSTLFGSGISTDVLGKSFRVDARTIELFQWSTIQN